MQKKSTKKKEKKPKEQKQIPLLLHYMIAVVSNPPAIKSAVVGSAAPDRPLESQRALYKELFKEFEGSIVDPGDFTLSWTGHIKNPDFI